MHRETTKQASFTWTVRTKKNFKTSRHKLCENDIKKKKIFNKIPHANCHLGQEVEYNTVFIIFNDPQFSSGGGRKEMGPTFDQYDRSISNPLLHYETIHTWGPVTLLAC